MAARQYPQRPKVSQLLRVVARHGRWTLVAGLVAGVLLPGPAATLTPALPYIVAVLLALTALRLGPERIVSGMTPLPQGIARVLVLQLALPLGVAVTLGWTGSLFVFALVLMLAAAPIVGGPNIAVMLGAQPEPAMRLLLVGTVLMPLTVIPVFWAMPAFGDLSLALLAALRLLVTLAAALGLGLAARLVIKDPDPDVIDGLTAGVLAILVVGLMSAFTPTLLGAPILALAWLGFAFAINLGLQLLTVWTTQDVSEAVAAGNRNISIFLVALPPEIAQPLLLFLGCYQLPMFLTPILLPKLLRLVGPAPHRR